MSNSKGGDHLSSVHDNPFIREFGKETVLTRQDVKGRGARKSSVDSLSTADNDSEQEYHVNSGFVNKLRSKFNLLNEGSNKVTLSRKSASLENLLDSSHNSYGLKSQRQPGKTSHDDSKVQSRKDASVELRKKPGTTVRTTNRPRSSDEQIGASSKPPLVKKKETEYSNQNHVIRGGTKPPIPKKKSTDTSAVRQSRNFTSDSTKHKTEHHDWKVAPDLEKIGRDNIVIIESSSPCIRRKSDKSEPTKVERVEKVDKDENRQAKPLRDKPADENELPKPNTVSNFRSLFEKTKKTSDAISNWRQSPTRTSAGSDSPTVASPAGTPRSPLVRMNDDNVFEKSFKTTSSPEVGKDSPRSSSSNDSLVTKQSPRNSAAEIAENVDTTSMSRQKSFDVFETSPRDRDGSPSSPTPLSPRLSSNVAPEHPLSNIFDSSSVVKKDKPKKTKPAVSARKPNIPKDTIELKHEADKKKPSLSNIEIKPSSDNISEKTNAGRDYSPTQQMKDNNVVSTGRSSGKISPRKTKIFDSSSMVKKDKPSPEFVPSPTDKFFSSSPVKDQPPADSIENKTQTTKPNISVNQVELNGNSEKSQTGGTLFKTNIAIKNEPTRPARSKEKISVPMLPQENIMNEPVKPRSKPADNKASPVTGMSSYLANKLKKDSNGQQSALTNGSAPSPVPRKRQAPSAPVVNGTDKLIEKEELPPPLPTSPEPEIPKSNIDDMIKRKKKAAQTANKMVFDSSKIVKKKKETPKRKPPRKTLEELNKNVMSEPAVPLLDLSSITNDKAETEYQEGYIPTEIKPCPFRFVGAEVKFEQSPYKKKKKRGVKLAFDETATTFEYEREEAALEAYLRDHPDEVEEARRQEEEYEGVVTVTPGDDDDTTAAQEPAADTTMKSNTVIGMSSGALTNYKSKMQVQDFQFGSTPEPDVYVASSYDHDDHEEDGMNLLPADDSELDTFSAETGKADLLF